MHVICLSRSPLSSNASSHRYEIQMSIFNMEILSSGNYTREINMASRKWLNTKSYLVKHIASSARLG